MNRYAAPILAMVCVIVSTGVVPIQTSSVPEHVRGHLLLAGGGTTVDAIVERAFELAGSRNARLLIVPQASASPDAGTSSRDFWVEHGATHVGVLDHTDKPGSIAAIESADIIWMPGGSQSRLVQSLADAGLIDAIRDRYRAGAVIGGTSAGAAAASTKMILGGDRAIDDAIQAGGTQVGNGMALLPTAIVDQHFIARQRFNRLLACVLDHPALLGVGIDERTALVVSGNHWEVIGEGNVLVIDARASRLAVTKPGAHHGVTDVRLHLLRAGDRFQSERPQDVHASPAQ